MSHNKTDWGKVLSKFFTDTLNREKYIITQKEHLLSIRNFIPYHIFAMLDCDHKNQLFLRDFVSYLDNKGVNYKETDLREVVRQYDTDKDFSLDYKEVLNLFVPYNNSKWEEYIEMEEPDYIIDVPHEIDFAITKIIESEIKIAGEFSKLAGKLSKASDFNTYDAFRLIDFTKKNYIDPGSLEYFLSENECKISYDDVEILFFRLDRNKDGRISYEEFKDIFLWREYMETEIENDDADMNERENQRNNERKEKNKDIDREKQRDNKNNQNNKSANKNDRYIDNNNNNRDNNNPNNNIQTFQKNSTGTHGTEQEENNNTNYKVNNETQLPTNNNKNINNNSNSNCKVSNNEGNRSRSMPINSLPVNKLGQTQNMNNNNNHINTEDDIKPVVNPNKKFENMGINEKTHEEDQADNVDNNNSKSNLNKNNRVEDKEPSKPNKNDDDNDREEKNNNNYNQVNRNRSNARSNSQNRGGEIKDENNEKDRPNTNHKNHTNNQSQSNNHYNNIPTNNRSSTPTNSNQSQSYKSYNDRTPNNRTSNNDKTSNNRTPNNKNINGDEIYSRPLNYDYNKPQTIFNKKNQYKNKYCSAERIYDKEYDETDHHDQMNNTMNSVNNQNNSNNGKNKNNNENYMSRSIDRNCEKKYNNHKYPDKDTKKYVKQCNKVDRKYENYKFKSPIKEMKDTSDYLGLNFKYGTTTDFNSTIPNSNNNDFNNSQNFNTLNNSQNFNTSHNNSLPMNTPTLNNSPHKVGSSNSPHKGTQSDFNPNQSVISNPFNNSQSNFPANTLPNKYNNFNNLSTSFKSRTQERLNHETNLSKSLGMVLRELLDLEMKTENLRESLSIMNDFRLSSAFRLFDHNYIGYLSLYDFKEALARLNVKSTTEDFKIFYKRWDTDKDGKLIYMEFCNMLTPKKSDYSQILRNRQTSGLLEENISPETINLLTKLFRNLIENESIADNTKYHLSNCQDFNFYDAFDLIKGNNNLDYITKDNLSMFLQSEGTFCSGTEIELIFYRFDSNCDGKISFNEFSQALGNSRI